MLFTNRNITLRGIHNHSQITTECDHIPPELLLKDDINITDPDDNATDNQVTLPPLPMSSLSTSVISIVPDNLNLNVSLKEPPGPPPLTRRPSIISTTNDNIQQQAYTRVIEPQTDPPSNHI